MVSLAFAQGFLSRHSLNPIQVWALQYHMIMQRRLVVSDAENALEAHCSVMWPERWRQLYGSQDGDVGEAFEGEQELPVDSSDLTQWANSIGQQRSMTGAEIEMSGNRYLGFAEGVGKRV